MGKWKDRQEKDETEEEIERKVVLEDILWSAE